LLGTDQAIF